MGSANYLVGLDVGSTTVKAVVVDEAGDRIVWSDYQRHETKQPEKTLEFLRRMEAELTLGHDNCRVFIDGAFVDYPPILDRPIAAGRHTVSFQWPEGGRTEQAVDITAGAPSYVTGRRD